MDNPVAYGGVPMTGRPEPDVNPAVRPQADILEIDDSKATDTYANFCHITGSPEELVIDFGLNPQPTGKPVAEKTRLAGPHANCGSVSW